MHFIITNRPKPVRIQTVSADVVQTIASRMLDPMPPLMGYFAHTGEAYRKVLGASAEEHVIDATIAAAKERAAVERAGMRSGVADFVSQMRR